MPERFTAKFESADSRESADSLRENHDQAKYSTEKLQTQKKSQEKFDTDLLDQIQNIDSELDQELGNVEPFISESNLDDFLKENYPTNKDARNIAEGYLAMQNVLGGEVTAEKLKDYLSFELAENLELSNEDKIKAFKEQLSIEGKSSESILKSLIAKFKNDPDVNTWVENWQKFLRLHELAKTKSPKERKAIQNIIARADYTNENAFTVSLNTIRSSPELSEATKLEIFTEFDGSVVTSVSQMDSGLKFLRDRKQKAQELLNTKADQLDSINSEIKNLKDQLNQLPDNNSKRKELEKQLSEKTNFLKRTEHQVELLEAESNKETAFEIRKNFSAKLNKNGIRSIKGEYFSIQLPSNALPFTGTKNLRSVNLAFVCDPLKRFGIMNEVFSPNLDSGTAPSKSHRDTGHLILDSLGIIDTEILCEKDIATVNRDLSRIMDSGILSARDHLTQLGLYSITDQSLNMKRFKRALQFAKENRKMNQKTFSEQLKRAL